MIVCKTSMEALKNKLAGGMARYTTPAADMPDQEYEHLVKETATLISRTYIATAKLVEKWPVDLIKRRLYASQKASNPAMEWWVMRKYDR